MFSLEEGTIVHDEMGKIPRKRGEQIEKVCICLTGVPYRRKGRTVKSNIDNRMVDWFLVLKKGRKSSDSEA